MTKNAGTYYDANQLMLALTFKAAYKGSLHLYAVDFDHAGRQRGRNCEWPQSAVG